MAGEIQHNQLGKTASKEKGTKGNCPFYISLVHYNNLRESCIGPIAGVNWVNASMIDIDQPVEETQRPRQKKKRIE